MSDLIVQTCKVSEIKKHPNADALEICIVNGWQVVTRLGTLKKDDIVVYFPPDTILPLKWTDKYEVTKYCQERPQGMRVRQARFRGEPSFGFVVKAPEGFNDVGVNMISLYEAVKYEPPVLGMAGDIMGADPELFNKFTDIQNLRHYPDMFADGEEVVCTEKCHGCVHATTRVRLVNGEEREILDIVPDDMVLSYNENTREFEGKRVLAVLVQPTEPRLAWYDLKFDNGRTLTCTADHPVLTVNRSWVNAEDLNSNDDILSA